MKTQALIILLLTSVTIFAQTDSIEENDTLFYRKNAISINTVPILNSLLGGVNRSDYSITYKLANGKRSLRTKLYANDYKFSQNSSYPEVYDSLSFVMNSYYYTAYNTGLKLGVEYYRIIKSKQRFIYGADINFGYNEIYKKTIKTEHIFDDTLNTSIISPEVGGDKRINNSYFVGISPVLGLEFFFNDAFSLALLVDIDVSYVYMEIRNKETIRTNKFLDVKEQIGIYLTYNF